MGPPDKKKKCAAATSNKRCSRKKPSKECQPSPSKTSCKRDFDQCKESPSEEVCLSAPPSNEETLDPARPKSCNDTKPVSRCASKKKSSATCGKAKKSSSKRIDSEPPPTCKKSPKPEPESQNGAITKKKSSSSSPDSSRRSPKSKTSSEKSLGLDSAPEHKKISSSDSKGNDSQHAELAILDGEQAAFHHGGFKKSEERYEGKQHFSAIGIEIALRYLRKKGIKAKAMLYEGKQRSEETKAVIDRLNAKGLVEFVPDADYYEKLYTYAFANQCHVFSPARDKIEKYDKVHFLDEHLIPFAFIRDDFQPNPNPSRIGSSVFKGRTSRIADKNGKEKSIVPSS